MSESAINKARVISELFSQEQEQRDIQSLLMGKRIKEDGREDAMSVAFVERALLGMGEHTLDIGTYQDLYAKSCMVLGMNDKSRCSVDDTEWASRKLEELFSLSLGEEKATSLLTGEVCERLLSHMQDPDASPYPEHVNKAMDAFLTNERRQFLIDRAKENAFEHSYDPAAIAGIVEKYNLKKDPEPPTADQPALSDQTFKQTNVIEMAQQAEKDHLKHKLSEDLQTDALMRLNAILDDHPQLVNRTLVDKLKTFAASQVDKVIDPHHLTYPKESIFSETLAEMDINGRAKKTLLTYRRPLLGGLSVEFDSPYSQRDENGKPMRPADATFDIAALKLRSEGVKNPHITSRFRDPEAAIMFMQNCVRSLVDAGYNIDDISVGRNLQHAFENIKADFAPVISMGEAPDEAQVDPELIPEPKAAPGYHAPRTVLPEEEVVQANQTLNGKLNVLTNLLNDPERQVDVDQWEIDDITNCMDIAEKTGALTNGSSWQELQSTPGVAPNLVETLQKVQDYVGHLVDKANPAHEKHKPLGVRELEKLAGIGELRLRTTFDKERLGDSINSMKAQVVAHKEAAKQGAANTQNDVANGQHEPSSKQSNDGASDSVGEAKQAPLQDDMMHGEPDQSQSPTNDGPPDWILEAENAPLQDDMMHGEPDQSQSPTNDGPPDWILEAEKAPLQDDMMHGDPDQSQSPTNDGPPDWVQEAERASLEGGVESSHPAEPKNVAPLGDQEPLANSEGSGLPQAEPETEQRKKPEAGESQTEINLSDEKWARIADIEEWAKIDGKDLSDLVNLIREEAKAVHSQLATFSDFEKMDVVALSNLVTNVRETLDALVSEDGLQPGNDEHELIRRIDPALLTEKETAALNELNQKAERALAPEPQPENTAKQDMSEQEASISRPSM